MKRIQPRQNRQTTRKLTHRNPVSRQTGTMGNGRTDNGRTALKPMGSVRTKRASGKAPVPTETSQAIGPNPAIRQSSR
ncbi:hypothetical protein GCM10028773_02130 [Spirosoma koreense]